MIKALLLGVGELFEALPEETRLEVASWLDPATFTSFFFTNKRYHTLGFQLFEEKILFGEHFIQECVRRGHVGLAKWAIYELKCPLDWVETACKSIVECSENALAMADLLTPLLKAKFQEELEAIDPKYITYLGADWQFNLSFFQLGAVVAMLKSAEDFDKLLFERNLAKIYNFASSLVSFPDHSIMRITWPEALEFLMCPAFWDLLHQNGLEEKLILDINNRASFRRKPFDIDLSEPNDGTIGNSKVKLYFVTLFLAPTDGSSFVLDWVLENVPIDKLVKTYMNYPLEILASIGGPVATKSFQKLVTFCKLHSISMKVDGLGTDDFGLAQTALRKKNKSILKIILDEDMYDIDPGLGMHHYASLAVAYVYGTLAALEKEAPELKAKFDGFLLTPENFYWDALSLGIHLDISFLEYFAVFRGCKLPHMVANKFIQCAERTYLAQEGDYISAYDWALEHFPSCGLDLCDEDHSETMQFESGFGELLLHWKSFNYIVRHADIPSLKVICSYLRDDIPRWFRSIKKGRGISRRKYLKLAFDSLIERGLLDRKQFVVSLNVYTTLGIKANLVSPEIIHMAGLEDSD